jgi:hypothetical protein
VFDGFSKVPSPVFSYEPVMPPESYLFPTDVAVRIEAPATRRRSAPASPNRLVRARKLGRALRSSRFENEQIASKVR